MFSLKSLRQNKSEKLNDVDKNEFCKTLKITLEAYYSISTTTGNQKLART